MSDLTPNNDPFLQNPYPDDEIDLKQLFLVLWDGKWLISALTGIAAGISVLIALSLPNIYTAKALLAPAEQSGGGMSALMQQYAGLASLAGVSLPGEEGSSRAQLGMALMTSRGFIGEFVDRRKIMPELMAVESWDLDSGRIIFDDKRYDAETDQWVRVVRPPFNSRPSLLEAHSAFEAILDVSQDAETGFITVAVEHKSPKIAAQWVNWLVEDANNAIRSQDVEEAKRAINFLQEQVIKTSLTELQSVFFDLIQSQTETVMLAEIREEYIFRVIDSAMPPEKRSRPHRALICILGTSFGAIFGFILVFARYVYKENMYVPKP